MFKYILKRIALMFFTFFVITTICFFLVKLLPNVPAKQFGKDEFLILQKREQMGYNKPLIEQFFIFIGRSFFGGDWGISESLYIGSDVFSVFISKLPATLYVNFLAMLISVPIGLGLGIYAALRKNRWQDHTISTGVMIFISVPSYVYAFLVQYFLCFKLRIFPSLMDSGYNYFSISMLMSALPAVLSLSFPTIASFTRYTRAELTEVLTSEFMLLARAKGLTKGQATLRHALRNSMVPIFPMIIGEFIGILSGSLIIEKIFSVPGVGALYVSSISGLDYNFFMLLSSFYTLIGLSAGILVDISYGIIDPRIRMGAR